MAFTPLLQSGERSDDGIHSTVVAMTEVCLEQELQQNTPGVLLSSSCLELKLQQNMAWSSTQQTMPGAALNRAKWHPHRSPSTTMYSILAATLLTLFLGFNQSNVVDEQQEFFIGGMEDVAYPMIFHK